MSGKGSKMATGKPSPRLPSSLPGFREASDMATLLADAMRPLVDQMATMNTKMDAMQKSLDTTNRTSEKLMMEMVDVRAKTEKIDKRLKKVEAEKKSETGLLLKLQMERANFALRFQGVPEKKGENLRMLLTEAIAPMVGFKAEEFQSELDTLYRVYPEYLKKKNLPGEVMVRFSRRSTRDLVLKASSKGTLKILGVEIKVLKDIPFEIRKKRKPYKKLTMWLQSQQIQYFWLVPEGVGFLYKEKKQRIDSVGKAKTFLALCNSKNGSGEDSLELQETCHGLTSSREESENEEETGGEEGEGSGSESELGAAAPKPELKKKKGKK